MPVRGFPTQQLSPMYRLLLYCRAQSLSKATNLWKKASRKTNTLVLKTRIRRIICPLFALVYIDPKTNYNLENSYYVQITMSSHCMAKYTKPLINQNQPVTSPTYSCIMLHPRPKSSQGVKYASPLSIRACWALIQSHKLELRTTNQEHESFDSHF